MKNIIIGTAGHIDHGKTTLIKALTGRDTDRLKEEKERGITIELGFTYFDLPSGKRAGIVDVPGHERFIKSMLAGVTGIDIALLVIAADEGIMPQTKEHLDILDMLGLKSGIVVLTKCGTVDDEWKEIVIEDIRENLEGTFLENADIVSVDSVSRYGIDDLIEKIDRLSDEVEDRKIFGNPRLPVDRVFTVGGFGTVVTGTLISGRFGIGDVVQVYPGDTAGKVRSLQVHGQQVEEAYAGQRVAVNISGIKKSDVRRGDIVALEGSMKPTMMLDVKLRLLKDSQRIIENRTRVRLYIGSKEVLCRAVLLDKDKLTPGEECFAQLRLEESIVASKDDRFIIRFYSPMITIGGGVILDANPAKKKRFDVDQIEALEIKEAGDFSDVIEDLVRKKSSEFLTMKDLSVLTSSTQGELGEYVESLKLQNKIVIFDLAKDRYLIHCEYMAKLAIQMSEEIKKYHAQHPLRVGIAKEEIKSKFIPKAKSKLADSIISKLTESTGIRSFNDKLYMKDFAVEFKGSLSEIKDLIEKSYIDAGFSSLKRDELSDGLMKRKYKRNEIDQVFEALVEKNTLVRIGEDTLIHHDVFEASKDKVIEYLEANGEAAVGEIRDVLDANRKLTLALLEELDNLKVTKRKEDKRILYKQN